MKNGTKTKKRRSVAPLEFTRIENGFDAPIKLVSEANGREHWGAKYGRKKAQQAAVHVGWRQFHLKPTLPCRVVLTRLGKREMDKDNNVGSFKHVQDAVAQLLKVDDGDSTKVQWEYKQIVNSRAEVGVRIEIFEGDNDEQV